MGTAQVARVRIPAQGKTRHREADTAGVKRVQRLRAPIEPVSGPLKAAQRLDRCRSKGVAGAQMHVRGAVLAWNTHKWGRLLQPRHLAGRYASRRAA